MKTLYIIRHAKSSWDDPDLPDFERPLNARGERDAPKMGKRLKEKDIHPQVMISSPAKRAIITCKRICEVLGCPPQIIKTNQKLYHASPTELLKVVKDLKDKFDVAMIFGHNPGLTDFVNEIGSDVMISNVPTCGVVALRFNVDSWKELEWNSGELLFFDFPKKLD